MTVGILVAGLAAGAFGADALTLTPGGTEVVIARKAPWATVFAAQEMTNFLSRVLGRPVPIVATDVLVSDGKVQIVLGTNALSQAAGVDLAGLAHDGYVLKTAGGRLFIAGEDEAKPSRSGSFLRGTANGVYAFLEDFAGCRFYFPDELGEIVPRKDRIAVPVLDRRDAPAFAERVHSDYGPGPQGAWFRKDDPRENELKKLYRIRLRLGSTKYSYGHGLYKMRYPARFAKSHPEYFLQQKNGERYLIDTGKAPWARNAKLCFSSGITEEIYQDIRAYVTGQPASSRGLDAWPAHCHDYSFFHIGAADGTWPCWCEKCQASYRDMSDPSYMTEQIWGLAKSWAERLTAEGLHCVLGLSAYAQWREPPAFDLPPNLLVVITSYGPWGARSDQLEKDLALLRKWTAKLGHGVINHTYPGKFGNYNTPLNPEVPAVTPRAWARYYQAAAPCLSGPTGGSFPETDTDRWMHNMLNLYVFSRVAWNPSVDAEAVLKEHYALMYGPAAQEMEAFFTALEDIWMDEILGKTENTSVGPVTQTPSDLTIWTRIYSPERRKEFRRLFESAEAKLAPGSLEARRVAFMRGEFLDRLDAKAASVAAAADPAAELQRRASSSERSVVENGDFEADMKGWSGAGTYDADASVDGKGGSVRLVCTGMPVSVSRPLGDRLACDARYRVSYFFKQTRLGASKERHPGAFVMVFGPGGNGRKWMQSQNPEYGKEQEPCGWTHQSFEIVTGPGPEFKDKSSVRLCLSAPGTAWFDGVRIERIP